MAKGSEKRSRQVFSYGQASELSRTSYKTSTSLKRPAEQSQAYERTTRAKHEHKRSGSYEHYTRKEKASSGDLHVEKGTGRVGVKDEFTKSSTIKIGNKSGYTEYYTEERFRNVNFGSGSGRNGPNNYLTHYDNNNFSDNLDDGKNGGGHETVSDNAVDYNCDDDDSGLGYGSDDDYNDNDDNSGPGYDNDDNYCGNYDNYSDNDDY